MREHRTDIESLGAPLLVVGTGAAFQARRLMDQGLPFECLVDPEARLHRALGIGRVDWRAALRPATYVNYWRGWRRGGRQREITGDPRRLSGLAVFDAGWLTVRKGRSWAAMGARYERSAEPTDDPASMWDELDHGRDPTTT